jgi:lycopene cyclase domain-containing protein
VKYALLAAISLGASVVVYLIARTRAGQRNKVLMPVLWPAAILTLITIVGDNLMISSELFSYGHDALLGAYIGLMPVEDLSYPIIAVLLVSALGGSRER